MSKLNSIALVLILPVILSFVVYFGFLTHYTKDVYTDKSFSKQYDNGIYKYRILSKLLFKEIEKSLSKVNLRTYKEHQFLDEDTQESYYYAYFIINTVFLVLTCLLLYFILHHKNLHIQTENERLLLYLFVLFLLLFTQFVVTFYDLSSYFLHLLSIFVFLEFFKSNSKLWVVLTSVLIVLATLNRESSALILSFVVTVLFLNFGFKKELFVKLALPVFAYLITYIALRFILGFNSSESEFEFYNFTDKNNIMGMILFVIFANISSSFSNSAINKKSIKLMLLFSSPYLIMITISGIFFEIRLFVPIILSAVILSKLKFENYSVENLKINN